MSLETPQNCLSISQADHPECLTGQLCECCRKLIADDWIIPRAKGLGYSEKPYIEHHPTLSKIVESTLSGCKLCRLLAFGYKHWRENDRIYTTLVPEKYDEAEGVPFLLLKCTTESEKVGTDTGRESIVRYITGFDLQLGIESDGSVITRTGPFFQISAPSSMFASCRGVILLNLRQISFGSHVLAEFKTKGLILCK